MNAGESKRTSNPDLRFYLGPRTCMNWWISPARFDRLVTISGREDYDAAIAEGHNIVLLAPHFMSLEVSGLALQRERPMIGVYQYMKNSLMNTVALREGVNALVLAGLCLSANSRYGPC